MRWVWSKIQFKIEFKSRCVLNVHFRKRFLDKIRKLCIQFELLACTLFCASSEIKGEYFYFYICDLPTFTTNLCSESIAGSLVRWWTVDTYHPIFGAVLLRWMTKLAPIIELWHRVFLTRSILSSMWLGCDFCSQDCCTHIPNTVIYLITPVGMF